MTVDDRQSVPDIRLSDTRMTRTVSQVDKQTTDSVIGAQPEARTDVINIFNIGSRPVVLDKTSVEDRRRTSRTDPNAVSMTVLPFPAGTETT